MMILINKINELKQKLSFIDTRELLGMICTRFQIFGNNGAEVVKHSDIFSKTELKSPQKQLIYLAGLLMCTEDKSNTLQHQSDYKETTWYDDIEQDIQNITNEYMENFLNFDLSSDDKSIADRNLVAMNAFISYFETGILVYPEQMVDLINAVYSKYSDNIEQLTGLTVDDYIEFYDFTCGTIKTSIENFQKTAKKIHNFTNSLSVENGVDFEFKRINEFKSKINNEKSQNNIDGLNTITTTQIIKKFGKVKGEKLINLFTLKRSKGCFTYYNEKNPVASKPLCCINSDTFFVINTGFLITAIYDFITETLEDQNNKFYEKFRKYKSDCIEEIFLKYFKGMLGNKAMYHTSVCEIKGSNEHDIVIEYGDYIIIAEVKATKAKEPFFNPEKAYPRIRDHFKSDSGIGGAYTQAIRLKKFLESNKNITLYENGNKKFIIENTDEKTILPIVLTLSQFGGVAVNTTLLLEKEEKQPYPWVCNLYDFENLIQIQRYLNISSEELIKYIEWRIEHHEKCFSSDELDVVEAYFLSKEVRDKIKDNNVYLYSGIPNLIDKIYYEKKGIPYEHPAVQKHIRKVNKLGRNDLCPCESGLKFKKCCIGKGIFD